MKEKLLELFIYNGALLNFDFLNLYLYFPGIIGEKYIIISFLITLINIIINIAIGLICIKVGTLLKGYFNIKKNTIAHYNYPIVISIFFGILYPIYCITFGMFGGKITIKNTKYIILAHIMLGILFTTFILKINGII